MDHNSAARRLTTKAMEGKPDPDRDIWITELIERGHGALVGKITRKGERVFHFRYFGTKGQEWLRIGRYSKAGDTEQCWTVAQARSRALALAAMHRSGIVDLRKHFEAEAKTNNEAAALDLDRIQRERSAAIAAAEAARLAAERRVTVCQLFTRWAETELKPRVRTDGTRSGRKDGGQFLKEQFERRVFPVLGSVPVSDVTKADVMAVIDAAKADGRLRTANVLLAGMKQMFSFAVDREIIDKEPTARISKRHAGGKETMRTRVLSPDEVKELFRRMVASRRAGPVGRQREIPAVAPRTRLAVWVMLSTGARIGEAMGAVWSGPHVDAQSLAKLPEATDVKVGVVDLDAGTWYLPTTKNEREHLIHLSDFAKAQFRALRDLSAPFAGDQEKPPSVPWVFPNAAGDGPVCVKTFGKQLADRQRQGSKSMRGRTLDTQALSLSGGRWTAHDLRRTAATFMAELGISGDVIDECLNHVIESRVRRTYIRNRRLADQARAFDALGAKLSSLTGTGQLPSNVVPLIQSEAA